MAIARILVPVDYSDTSARAALVALDFAAALGATVDIVHVWGMPSHGFEFLAMDGSMHERPLHDVVRARAQREMERFVASLPVPPGVVVHHRVLAGHPASTLLEELSAYDLVVAGRVGETASSLLGSVAQRLIESDLAVVLLVPPGSGSVSFPPLSSRPSSG